MQNNRRKIFKLSVLLFLIFSIAIFPTIEKVNADTIPHYHDGMNLIPNEDQQERFLPTPLFDSDVVPPIYRYETVWPVYVKKDSDPASVKGEFVGNMGFLRPINPNPGSGTYENYSLGRTFAHKSTLSRWGKAFNGNPNYVERATEPVDLTRQSDKKVFTRYHSVEIGEKSGAYVIARKDDNKKDYLEVRTTPFPTAKITAPKSAKAGEEFDVTINAEEFNPFGNGIKYQIFHGNTLLKSGVNLTQKIENLKVPISINQTGKIVLTLKAQDMIERTTTVTTVVMIGDGNGSVPEPDPQEKPNIPPIADIWVEPEHYWVEDVHFIDNSYDPDGEIISRDLTVDGTSTTNPRKFTRVTQPEEHVVELTVVDNDGASDTDSKTFKILPTTPRAEFSIGGTSKVNRRITLDGTLSNKVSPIHIAPIDYNLTKWTIKPLTDGVTQEDILIRNSSDRSKRDFLVRKKGDYEITLTVTNIFGETSEPVTKVITVEPDLKPIPKFTVDSAKYIRDNEGEKNAVITLTDHSVSPDDDVIKKRIWTVEFDSNNDGYFGTALDEPKRVISSSNETTVKFLTNKVGNYRFSLEVIEDFGQETLPEFINEEHYLRDESIVLDSKGSVTTYQDPSNFNIPEYDKAVEVINVAPVIDFGVRRQNKIDVVLNFGGMVTATRQHLTGPRPGAGINNGGGGGTYDHYYYTFDEADKNRLTSYASTMQANLLAKGIDANVVIDNSFYHQPDTDGVGVRNVPVWGWRDYGYYSYSSYSGTQPYSGDWEVTSSRSEPIYEVVWCYFDNSHNGGLIHSHEPPCSDPRNEIREQVGTRYYASLRKYNPDLRFEITHYQNEGLNSTEQVNTTDFTDAYKNRQYRPDAARLYVRMDKTPWDWLGNSTKFNNFVNKTKNDNIYFWNMSIPNNRTNVERVLMASNRSGHFSLYDLVLDRNIQDIENYIINNYFMDEDGVNTTIVLGDKVDYTVNYTDHENDPELKREWKFTHDPTKINGRIIDNQPLAPIPQSGLYVDSPLQLTEVGTYRVQLRAQDDPVYDGDERFFNYRKWSDEEVQREYIINVHRRPIADFTFKIDPEDLGLTLDPTPSYDPDHEFNRPDKGIVEHTWLHYAVDGIKYDGPPPTHLSINKYYDVTLQVKDIDGAYGVVTKRISTFGFNQKPIALFDAPEIVVDTMPLNIIDRSYDPDGDPLTDYKISIRRQGESKNLMTLDHFPSTFKDIGLGAGVYVVSLTVTDIPKIPPPLTSDPYERIIEVVENNPPVSDFNLSPEPLLVNEINKYTDLSYDPDDHPLKNYSWTIEKLGDEDEVIETWNTGVPPEDWSTYGIGKFRVTQTVFDDPPFPLTSLSGTKSKIYYAVKGPQAPYALFDYEPSSPVEGDNIQLKDRSYDEDGEVVRWRWTIEAPNGSKVTQTVQNPTISNARIGVYKVTLDVWDDTGLQSKRPAYREIVVGARPANIPPVAMFTWEPFEPYLGETIRLDPDSSYDVDGTIVEYSWLIKSKEGRTTRSTQRYPSFIAASEYYDVTLTVKDNMGATGSVTERINVNIAKLIPLVTHTSRWKQYWKNQGYDEDVNLFLAGEKFIIELKTTPAESVEGKVNFGNEIGLVEIPSSSFKLINKTEFEYLWRAELWREDFERIPNGEYLFEFTGHHPVNNPRIQSRGVYLIEIVGNIYEPLGFHRNY